MSSINPLSVQCPTCNATVSMMCKQRGGSYTIVNGSPTHQTRIEIVARMEANLEKQSHLESLRHVAEGLRAIPRMPLTGIETAPSRPVGQGQHIFADVPLGVPVQSLVGADGRTIPAPAEEPQHDIATQASNLAAKLG